MRKRVALGPAIKAIRAAKSKQVPDDDEQDPGRFLGSRFAIECGISHSYLSNIEAGRKQPPEELLLRIAAKLKVDPSAISYVTEDAMEAVS